MRCLLVVVCAAALGGCGSAPRVHRPGEEWLAELKLEGNKAIASGELVPRLALYRNLEAGRALDPYQLTVDRDRLRAAYLRRGFFDATVTPRVTQEGGAQHVVFAIVEGRRSVARVVMEGLPLEVDAGKARALVALADGAPFDYAAYDAAKLPLVSLVENAGYPHVEVDAAVHAERDKGVATAQFVVRPGVRATFGPVSIAGTEGDLAGAIIGRLEFHEGDPYSAKALAASQRSIYELGRFSTVRIDPDRTAGAVVPVRISVSLASRHEIKLGGGVGYDPINFELRARIGGSYVNAAHPLWTFGADLRPAITEQHDFNDNELKVRALVTAYRQDMFRPRLRGELELSADYLTVEAYTSKGPRFRAGVTTPLGLTWLQLHAGWLIEYLVFTNIDVVDAEQHDLHLDEAQRRGAYELAVTADGRDDKLDPHRGVFAQLRATLGTPYALGAESYLQVTPEVRGYYPLGPVVVAARLRVGVIDGTVPVTERYYSGGANNHRGFAERNLSPSAATDDGTVVVGGAALLETGVELRIPLPGPIGLEVFLDGGDVTNTPSELDPSNLYWAPGVGMWLDVYGLKVRGDVGYRINRQTSDSVRENLSFHLGVGDSF